MKQGSTLFLRGVIFIISISVLALCVYVLPLIAKEMTDYYPIEWVYLPVLISMAASTIPFYIALFQALRLLGLIDKNEAFSELSVKALINIKYCAIVIGILYVLSMPFLYIISEGQDAPGVLMIGLIVIFAASVIATCVAVFEKLLQSAIDIKSENDLTV